MPILVRARRPHVLVLLACLTAACIAPIVPDPHAEGSSSGGGDEPATTVPLPPAESTTEPTESSGSTAALTGHDPSSTAGSSTGEGGLGEGEPCELYVQDCAPGLKCMPYSTDGSSWWNATACFPIDPDPHDLGDPCQWTGGLWSGYDDCDVGQVCWTFDEEPGVCKGVCQTDDPNNWDKSTYTCEDPAATPYIGCQDCFCICETPCDPLGQNCGEGQECIPSGYDFFQCGPDASGDAGVYGDPCEFVNVCDPGLVCLDAQWVPGCEGFGCCSPLCDVTAPNTCPGAAEGQICQAWYEPGQAPIGLEDVGVCAIPQ